MLMVGLNGSIWPCEGPNLKKINVEQVCGLNHLAKCFLQYIKNLVSEPPQNRVHISQNL